MAPAKKGGSGPTTLKGFNLNLKKIQLINPPKLAGVIIISVSDPHRFLCGSGILKMSIWSGSGSMKVKFEKSKKILFFK